MTEPASWAVTYFSSFIFSILYTPTPNHNQPQRKKEKNVTAQEGKQDGLLVQFRVHIHDEEDNHNEAYLGHPRRVMELEVRTGLDIHKHRDQRATVQEQGAGLRHAEVHRGEGVGG